MSAFPKISLNKFEIRRIRNGHPWVYPKSIESQPEGLKTGDQVSVFGPKGEVLGSALYHAKSKIRLRILSREIEALDTAFFEKRLRTALEYRKRMLGERISYRLINSESDELSGLIVDCYEKATLFQVTSFGLEQRKASIVEAIRKVVDPDILVERNDVSNRKFEGLEEIKKVHFQKDPSQDLENYRITVNGVHYVSNLIEGNKTGLYLDQIENHAKFGKVLARYRNARVLDCFSYIGGFSLSAGRSEYVSEVIGVDQSAECIEKAQINAELNGTSAKCSFEKANVFDWLRIKSSDPEQIGAYDIVVLDPPSFTKNRHTVDGAIRGYKELHVRALRLLKPGGTLLTFSCSHHISEDLLRSIVFEAACDTGVRLIECETYQQSPDHPIVPSIPESYYLKGFAYYKT